MGPASTSRCHSTFSESADGGTAALDALAKMAEGKRNATAAGGGGGGGSSGGGGSGSDGSGPGSGDGGSGTPAVAAESERRAWERSLASQRPKRTNRGADLALSWGRRRSEGVRKRQRELHSSYFPDRRPLGAQV